MPHVFTMSSSPSSPTAINRYPQWVHPAPRLYVVEFVTTLRCPYSPTLLHHCLPSSSTLIAGIYYNIPWMKQYQHNHHFHQMQWCKRENRNRNLLALKGRIIENILIQTRGWVIEEEGEDQMAACFMRKGQMRGHLQQTLLQGLIHSLTSILSCKVSGVDRMIQGREVDSFMYFMHFPLLYSRTN